MDGPAALREARESRSLSQEQVAIALGLHSKGYVSRIESGEITPSLRLALRIERWSAGRVRAESLLSAEDADLLKRTPSPADSTGEPGPDSRPDSRTCLAPDSPIFLTPAERPA